MGELFRQWKGQCKGPEAEAGFTGSEKSMAPFIQASIQKAASEYLLRATHLTGGCGSLRSQKSREKNTIVLVQPGILCSK